MVHHKKVLLRGSGGGGLKVGSGLAWSQDVTDASGRAIVVELPLWINGTNQPPTGEARHPQGGTSTRNRRIQAQKTMTVSQSKSSKLWI
jgi:hypothetical protein